MNTTMQPIAMCRIVLDVTDVKGEAQYILDSRSEFKQHNRAIIHSRGRHELTVNARGGDHRFDQSAVLVLGVHFVPRGTTNGQKLVLCSHLVSQKPPLAGRSLVHRSGLSLLQPNPLVEDLPRHRSSQHYHRKKDQKQTHCDIGLGFRGR